MTLHVTVHGQGRPLVLLHGWGFDGHIWQALMPALSARFQLYVVDLPGFGRSANMDWDAFKLALLQVLPSCFAVAGWSLGGLFATRLAVEVPSRITHVLNIAATPRFIQDDHWPGFEPSVFTAFSDDLVTHPERTWKRFTRLQGVKHGIFPPTIGWSGLRAGLDVLQTWDLRALLPQLNMPVCYVFGQLDGITSPALMPCMQARYPRFHYKLFHEAAHTPFLSHPVEFLALLDDFFKHPQAGWTAQFNAIADAGQDETRIDLPNQFNEDEWV